MGVGEKISCRGLSRSTRCVSGGTFCFSEYDRFSAWIIKSRCFSRSSVSVVVSVVVSLLVFVFVIVSVTVLLYVLIFWVVRVVAIVSY